MLRVRRCAALSGFRLPTLPPVASACRLRSVKTRNAVLVNRFRTQLRLEGTPMVSQQQTPKPRIDEFPSDRSQLAAMSPEERAAVYLNSIRRAMSFFVLLAIAGIVLGIIALMKN